MAGYDYAMIRLKTSFAEAKQVLDPQNTPADLRVHPQIMLRPSQLYFQVTNFTTNYNFSSINNAYIIDVNGVVLQDISFDPNFGALTFDDINGAKQIAFEIGFFNFDYHYQEVYLKIVTDTVTFYSNGFNITDDGKHEYVRVDYRDYGRSSLKGIDFSVPELQDKMLSIGLRGFYNDVDPQTEQTGYRQISTGLEVTSEVQIYNMFQFKFQYATPFTIVHGGRVWSSDVLYINGVRMSNKPAQKTDGRIEMSNKKPNEISGTLDFTDTFQWEPQLVTGFQVVERFQPPGTYSLEGFLGAAGNIGQLRFNRNIGTLPPEFNVMLYKNNALQVVVSYPGFASDGISNIQIIAGELETDIMLIVFSDLYFDEEGVYDFVVQPVPDENGIFWNGYEMGEWRFIINDGIHTLVFNEVFN